MADLRYHLSEMILKIDVASIYEWGIGADDGFSQTTF